MPRAATDETRDFGPDEPIRLDTAARRAFPDGSMTVSGLRREAQRGRLVTERIAGKDYTTLANIAAMRELCRVEAKAPASGSAKRAGTAKPRGSSSMDNAKSAQDAALAILNKLGSSSRITSTKPTARKGGNVLSLASASRT